MELHEIKKFLYSKGNGNWPSEEMGKYTEWKFFKGRSTNVK
jgi:hypothetical protein